MRRIVPSLFALALALWPIEADATACTAGCTQFIEAGSSTTTNTTTLTSVVAGHSITAFYCFTAAVTISSFTIGGVAATIGGATSTTSGHTCGLANAVNVASGSIVTTVTYSAACGSCQLLTEEWPDTSTTGTMNGMNSTATSGSIANTPIPSGAFTTTGSSDRVESFYLQLAAIAPTLPGGYAVAENSIFASTGIMSVFATGVTPGSQNPTFLSGAGSNDTSNSAAGFILVAAAPPAGHPRLLKDVGQ